MSWFFKKPTRHYIAVITKHDESEPLKNEIALCIELDSIVRAKQLIRHQILMNILRNTATCLDTGKVNNVYPPEHEDVIKRQEACLKMLCFESHNEILHGENALEAIGEALIPSDSFTTVKERDEYYENFTSKQLSFWTLDARMLRTVYGVFLRARNGDEQ